MLEKETKIRQDAQLVMLLRQKWHEEIERAVDKVKSCIVPARRQTKIDKWFPKQWHKALAARKRRDRAIGKQAEGSPLR